MKVVRAFTALAVRGVKALLPLALTKDSVPRPAGRTSITVAAVACCGPELPTVSTKLVVWPTTKVEVVAALLRERLVSGRHL